MPSRLCFVPLVLLVLATQPAAAQNDSTRSDRWLGITEYDGPRRLELSASAGYALSTEWSDLVALQVADAQGALYRQVLLRSVAVAPGAGGAAAVTYWRGRHGFRVLAGFSRSCLTTATRCRGGDRVPEPDGSALAIAEVGMDVWRYGVEGIIGLRNWKRSRVWRPYAVLGLGGVTYDADEDALPLFPASVDTLVPPPGAPPGSVVIRDGTSTLLVATDELGLEHVFGLTLGIGMDLRMPIDIGGVGLRVELADQITRSPFRVRVAQLEADGRHRDSAEVVFQPGAVHNLRVSAGVMLEFPLRGPREEREPTAWR